MGPRCGSGAPGPDRDGRRAPRPGSPHGTAPGPWEAARGGRPEAWARTSPLAGRCDGRRRGGGIQGRIAGRRLCGARGPGRRGTPSRRADRPGPSELEVRRRGAASRAAARLLRARRWPEDQGRRLPRGGAPRLAPLEARGSAFRGRLPFGSSVSPAGCRSCGAGSPEPRSRRGREAPGRRGSRSAGRAAAWGRGDFVFHFGCFLDRIHEGRSGAARALLVRRAGSPPGSYRGARWVEPRGPEIGRKPGNHGKPLFCFVSSVPSTQTTASRVLGGVAPGHGILDPEDRIRKLGDGFSGLRRKK